jgi:uncharacterized protein
MVDAENRSSARPATAPNSRRAVRVETVTPVLPSPTPPADRIDLLDVLRGVALLGILLANMPVYSHPIAALMAGEPTAQGRIDEATAVVVRFLVEAKFYSLFSLLFGIGFAVQMSRASARGVAFVRIYARRLVALAVFGAAHALLVWPGDILLVYAVLGVVLLAFRDRQPSTLLLWAATFLVVPRIIDLGSLLLTSEATATAAAVERAAHMTSLAAEGWMIYGQGSFADVTRQRAHDYALLWPSIRLMAPGIVCMFLTGVWVIRRGLLQDLAASRPLITRIFAICLPLGVAVNVFLVVARSRAATGDVTWRLLSKVALSLGGPLLAVAYATGIALLVARPAWRRRLVPIGAAGRMALTSYLVQSLVCTTLFYGYGAGLLGRVNTAGGAALALGLWLAQIGASTLWLRRFRYGPAEWVWRWATYLRRPPMRQAATPPPA